MAWKARSWVSWKYEVNQKGPSWTRGFLSLPRKSSGKPTAGDDAAQAEWYDMDKITPAQMAGDHFLILENFKQFLSSIGPLN